MRPLSTSASSGITSWNTTSEPVSSRRCTVEPKAALFVRNLVQVDELNVRHALLQHRDARLDVRLAFLGGVVLGVFAQVSQFAGTFDLERQLELELAIERGDLVVELLEQLFFHLSSENVESCARGRLSGDGNMRAVPPPPITSRHNPLVARFKAAADADAEWMLLDGAHLVGEAVAAGLALECVAVDPDRVAAADLDALARAVPADRLVARRPLGARGDEPGAHAHRYRRAGGAPAPAVWRSSCTAATALLVGAVDIQDPGNLGAIVRAAEAGGASGVLTTPGGADPFGWKAVRGAMGSAFRLPGRPRRRRQTRWWTRRAPPACRWWPPSGTGTRRCTTVDFTQAHAHRAWAARAQGLPPDAGRGGRRAGVDSDDAARRVAQRGGGGGAPGVRGATAARSHNHEGTKARRRDDEFGPTLP